MKKIVFTGGGTLGHVMPNLYLFDELKNEFDCTYIGSYGIEKEVVPKYVNDFRCVPSTKFVRGRFFQNLKIPFVLIKSIRKCKKILKEVKPDVVFSKGGYVSLPVCLAARKLRIPIIAHESDYSFGLANKIILRLCNVMCVNFSNLTGKKPKITYTGPIFSREFEKKTIDKTNLKLDDDKKTLLIVGGSLGSQKLNDNVFAILKDLVKDFNVIHITGRGNKKVKSYGNYNAFEMTDQMSNLYNISHFVLGRSGAGVTAECFFKHLPMLLLPLENHASRGDQLQNAKYYESKGVAQIIHEDAITPTKLLEAINDFSKTIEEKKKKYSTLQQINGREKVVQLIKDIAKN